MAGETIQNYWMGFRYETLFSCSNFNKCVQQGTSKAFNPHHAYQASNHMCIFISIKRTYEEKTNVCLFAFVLNSVNPVYLVWLLWLPAVQSVSQQINYYCCYGYHSTVSNTLIWNIY